MSAAVEDAFDPTSSLSHRVEELIVDWAHLYSRPDWLPGVAQDIAKKIEDAVILNTVDLDGLFGEED